MGASAASYGRVSRYGLIAYGSSLDSIGPLARTVADAALLFSQIAGHDPRDATSMPMPVPALGGWTEDLRGLRVGVPREYFIDGMQPAVEQAVRAAISRPCALRSTTYRRSAQPRSRFRCRTRRTRCPCTT